MQMRARLWLLCSFLLAFGSVAGSIAVLVTCSQSEKFEAIGVVRVFLRNAILGFIRFLVGYEVDMPFCCLLRIYISMGFYSTEISIRRALSCNVA